MVNSNDSISSCNTVNSGTKRISVAMTSYNGEAFIKEQMDSIISQLTADDEIVISDDGSTDGTPDILHSYEGGPDHKRSPSRHQKEC